MLPDRLTLMGSIVLAAGMLVVGLALGGFGATAFAGNVSCVPTATATPDPTATSTPNIGTINSLQAAPTCTSTATAAPNRTLTPTKTVTPAASSTSVPVTPAATSTSRPLPTATQPGGGAGGAGIQPPNTGTGGSSEGGYGMWLLIGGMALATAGGGAVIAGVRRKL